MTESLPRKAIKEPKSGLKIKEPHNKRQVSECYHLHSLLRFVKVLHLTIFDS